MDCIAIRACTAVKRLAGTTQSVRASMGLSAARLRIGRSVRALYYCAVYCRVGARSRGTRAPGFRPDAAGWRFS
jgi:hypothetical protein